MDATNSHLTIDTRYDDSPERDFDEDDARYGEPWDHEEVTLVVGPTKDVAIEGELRQSSAAVVILAVAVVALTLACALAGRL